MICVAFLAQFIYYRSLEDNLIDLVKGCYFGGKCNSVGKKCRFMGKLYMIDLFSVKKYGAVGDGVTIDTPAINDAIRQCNDAGGGTVFFPAGTYLCGSIHLMSNVTLYLDTASTILGLPSNHKEYDSPEPPQPYHEYQDFGHNQWRNSLIWGENLENIAIIGNGLIDGGGILRTNGGGDKAISLKLCRNVLFRDFKMRRVGWFGIHVTGCDNLLIDSLTIDSTQNNVTIDKNNIVHVDANGSGAIDIDCCCNVRVSNCILNSTDDALCFKSSYALGYKRLCENIAVTNCIISGYKGDSVLNASYVDDINACGGIKLGTETNGGFKNITIDNCVVDNCRGICFR